MAGGSHRPLVAGDEGPVRRRYDLKQGGPSISTQVSPPTLEQYVGIVEALADEADKEHGDSGETMH